MLDSRSGWRTIAQKRHARRLWEQAGGKEIAKDEEKALVKRAQELTAEHSQRKTADILGFSLGKLQSLLKKAK
ncbi:MAG: hypothetical protein OXC79_10760 [Candidatus Poribacteria bacterium]|nr:hypothetical protein [Candidatus Poribacteria bacterium]